MLIIVTNLENIGLLLHVSLLEARTYPVIQSQEYDPIRSLQI